MRSLIRYTVLFLFIAGCSVPATGLRLAQPATTKGWPVTFSDNTYGFAFMCSSSSLCLAQAREICKGPVTMRPLGDIDKARSQLAVSGGVFLPAGSGLTAFAASCN